MNFFTAFFATALIGVSTGWAVTALLPKGIANAFISTKREFRVPEPLIKNWEAWHDYHCTKPNGQPCTPLGHRDAIEGEINALVPPDCVREVNDVVNTFLRKNRSFTPVQPWSIVSFDCCAREDHDKLGVAVAQSTHFVVTVEPLKPQFGQTFPNIAISRKSHCMTPLPLPVVGGVKYTPRHVSAWPDHFHVWLQVADDPKPSYIADDEVVYPSPLQPAERADVKYRVVNPYTSWIVVVAVYVYQLTQIDIVRGWSLPMFGVKYRP